MAKPPQSPPTKTEDSGEAADRTRDGGKSGAGGVDVARDGSKGRPPQTKS